MNNERFANRRRVKEIANESHQSSSPLAGTSALPSPLLAGQLPTDPNGLGGVYQGSTTYQGYTEAGPSNLHGTIEFSVFAQGRLRSVSPAIRRRSRPVPLHVQLFETGTESGMLRSRHFLVGLIDYADNVGHFTTPNIFGDAPTFDGTSYYEFVNPFGRDLLFRRRVTQTLGLAYQSPDRPTLTVATTIDDGSVGLNLDIPSPIPVPIPEPTRWFWLAAECWRSDCGNWPAESAIVERSKFVIRSAAVKAPASKRPPTIQYARVNRQNSLSADSRTES